MHRETHHVVMRWKWLMLVHLTKNIPTAEIWDTDIKLHVKLGFCALPTRHTRMQREYYPLGSNGG